MARKIPGLDEIRRLARERFGYESLRPAQEEVIRHVLAGRDTLAVMPTGAGKSAIYQVCALLIGGPTVIVSPLLALQRDQIEHIEDQSLAPAAAVNSTIGQRRTSEIRQQLEAGGLEYLFIAPEQFANPKTIETLRRAKPSLFVVDEAHCVTEWGHDFRPDYMRLDAAIEALGHPVVLALTATASPNTRDDIFERLGMRKPQIVVTGFDRPNIHLDVEKCPDEEAKQRVLVDRVQRSAKPGIVYVATRRNAEEIALLLRENNVKATHYHAGMNSAERHDVQDRFMAEDDGVIVATNAFGMGVDKPNVRFVFHYDIPESLDSYYQEIGRAGRDGEEARALLLYRAADVGRRRAMAAQGRLSEDEVEQVADLVGSAAGPVKAAEISARTELSDNKIAQTLNRLQDAGAVTIRADGNVAAGAADAREAVEQAVEEQEKFRQQRIGRVEIMKDYAETGECRRRYLLKYFGETLDHACGFCDTCEAGYAQAELRREKSLPFALKSRVQHKKLGEGTVLRYEDDKIVILFDEAGPKSLVTQYLLDHHLLSVAG